MFIFPLKHKIIEKLCRKQRKIIVSAVTLTAEMTIGNVIGAINKIKYLQNNSNYHILLFIANLHGITLSFGSLKYNPEQQQELIYKTYASYIACGIDPKRVTIFLQSDNSDHCELFYLCLCLARMGELEQMQQFQEKQKLLKQANQTTSVPVGLLTYPALMAADILLYNADLIIIGQDQKQHLEFTNLLVDRFNRMLVDKKPLFQRVESVDSLIEQSQFKIIAGNKIFDLQDPTKKMSKSVKSPKQTIFLADTPQEIRLKIFAAKTDSENVVRYDLKNKPGISNLMAIYAHLTNMDFAEITDKYQKQNYQVFKEDLILILNKYLQVIQARRNSLLKNPQLIEKALKKGAFVANQISNKRLLNLKKQLGISTSN